ncbi:glycosyltransferase family 2 protein [Fischerella sp. PCC 9605]|uniref:glycosyltransferase family 2 protein n=1 Tax=Fischerella sp. PCC 9605 TaxID=1173024 RepID=UPI000479A4BB|nr:glycosyltransferase family 2 protein [Fischerella sp. PCC 9605]
MQISVIIPVYNAEKYVRQAVESALSQPEVAEVILIEDASSDKSFNVCQELANEYPRVKLFRHKDQKNHGASASRNLGIQKANFDYIAFLDADDFYLPRRFKLASKKLNKCSEIDGVYEAVGIYFQDKESQEKWAFIGRSSRKLTTVNIIIEPDFLFETLLKKQEVGWFHADGLVVRKTIFERTGYFDENLEFSEDIVMWLKMAAVGKLIPGSLDIPVAMRRVHSHNHVTRFHKKLLYYSNLPRWETLFIWGYKNRLEPIKLALLFSQYADSITNQTLETKANLLPRNLYKLYKAITMITLIIKYPRIIQSLRHLWGFKKIIFMNKSMNLLRS